MIYVLLPYWSACRRARCGWARPSSPGQAQCLHPRAGRSQPPGTPL